MPTCRDLCCRVLAEPKVLFANNPTGCCSIGEDKGIVRSYAESGREGVACLPLNASAAQALPRTKHVSGEPGPHEV